MTVKYLTVIDSSDVVFDDVFDLNEDLEINHEHFQKLVEFIREPGPSFVGFFKTNRDKKVVLSNANEHSMFTGYVDTVPVWDCFDVACAETIRKHMVSGQMVLKLFDTTEHTLISITPAEVELI